MDFFTKEINKEYAKYLIFGTSVESPLFLLKDIEKSINLSKGDKVVFDQLLQTGISQNRFLVLTFGNEEFDLNTIKHINSAIIDNDTKIIVADFLRKNISLLKYSILHSDQKEIIMNGGVL